MTDKLTPRTARERALCRQAVVDAVMRLANLAAYPRPKNHFEFTRREADAERVAVERYPDPPRALRTVRCDTAGIHSYERPDTFWVTYEDGKFVSRFNIEHGIGANIQRGTGSATFDSVAACVRNRAGLSDDCLRELLALPADPYMPVVEPAEPRKIGYAVMGPAGTVDAAFWTGSVERCFRAATAYYSSRKIRELLLGDEVPADD